MNKKHLITCLLFLFLEYGCVASPTPIASQTSPSPISRQETITPELHLSNESTRPAAMLLPASEPAPEASPQQPVQTLLPEVAREQILDNLRGNGDCRLPCIWGFSPDMADQSVLDDFMAQFTEQSSPGIDTSLYASDHSGGLLVKLKENALQIIVDFSYEGSNKNELEMFTVNMRAMEETGKVFDWGEKEKIPVYGNELFNNTVSYYSLQKILENYGRPEKVLIRSFLGDPQRPDIKWQPFSLVLLYPQQGIFVEYVSPREESGNYFMGCPSKAAINLAVWNPKVNLPLKSVVQKAGTQINELNMDYFKSIEDATSMTLDIFYEVYSKSQNTLCIETPQEMWQP